MRSCSLIYYYFSFSICFAFSFISRSATFCSYSRRLISSLRAWSSFFFCSSRSASSINGFILSIANCLRVSLPSSELSSGSSFSISSVAYQTGRKSFSLFSLMMISLKTLSIDFLLQSGYLTLKSSMICYLDSKEPYTKLINFALYFRMVLGSPWPAS